MSTLASTSALTSLPANEFLDLLLSKSDTLCLMVTQGQITDCFYGPSGKNSSLFRELAQPGHMLDQVLPKTLVKLFDSQWQQLKSQRQTQRNGQDVKHSFNFSYSDASPKVYHSIDSSTSNIQAPQLLYYHTQIHCLDELDSYLLTVTKVAPRAFVTQDSGDTPVHRQVFEKSQAVKLIIEPKSGAIVDANEAAVKFYGYPLIQLQQMNIAEINQLSKQQIKQEMALAQREQRLYFNFVHRLSSGELRDVEVYSGPITLANTSLLYSIIHDITERKSAERKLIETEKRQRDLLNNTSSIIYYKDLDGRYISVNKAFEQVFNLSEAELVGKTDHDIMAAAEADVCREMDLKAYTADKPLENEESVYLQGQEHTYLSIKFPLKDADGKVYAICGISTDISERKRAEQQIIQQAHFDSLTQLPNRFLALDRLNQLLKEAQRNKDKVAILFLDLDDFKKVNDSLGHDVGDKLLVQAAERLRQVVRKSDTIGRLGGDEFIVLLKGLGQAEHARPVAENIVEQFRKAFIIDNRELLLTASIGIALYPDDGKDASALLQNADTAMYQAKNSGRNTFAYYTEEMNQDVARRLLIEQQLRAALAKNEFEVVFQPQFCLKQQKLVGAEALLRWRNSELGQVAPAEFIPVAEQTGVIVNIGRYVIEQTLAKLAVWQKIQPNLVISVNVSPRQFHHAGLAEYLKQYLEYYRVAANRFELEITEGVLMTGTKSIEKELNQISQYGVKLSMDDFGTGYSSLSYLRKYPFNLLKIDRSFVSNLTEQSKEHELIKAAIAMAQALGIKVIAEGVETEQQLALLAATDCDFVQGYLLGKPCSAEYFTHNYLGQSQSQIIKHSC